MSRKDAREVAYRLLFSHQFVTPEFSDEVIVGGLDDGQKLSKSDLAFVKELVLGVNEHKAELMNIIAQNTSGYTIDRILKTDLTALLLATFELKYSSLPAGIVINEAIELVKKYSSDRSFGFVNGVLSKVQKEISDGSN